MMKTLSIELYRTMYLIRKVEETIQEYYPEDEMKTPMHMSMGEEAIVAGVCHALKKTDQVLGTYRSHALYLAKTGETDRFFAELYGKVTGVAKGKSGSMHLSAPDHGLLCCSAIVGTSIPVAVGAAFANRYKNNGKVVAAFFGDGAIDEGVFWESLNAACLMKLPILFVCEDNGLAVHTGREQRHGFRSVNEIVSGFNCNVFESNTTDVEGVYQITKDAVSTMQTNSMPCFLKFHYYRYLEHVGICNDFDAGYRSEREYHAWLEKDPVQLQRRKLLANGVPEKELSELELAVDERIHKSVNLAKNAACAGASEAPEGVFQCG